MFAELEVEGVVDTPRDQTPFAQVGHTAEIDVAEKVRARKVCPVRPADGAASTSGDLVCVSAKPSRNRHDMGSATTMGVRARM